MKLYNRLILLPALLFTVVCSYGQEVHYNYDRGTNFAAYKTYQWVDVPGGAVTDELIDRDIKRAIDEQLAQKGLTRVEKGGDLLIGYRAAIEEEKRIDLFGSGQNLGGWGPWGGGMRSGSIQGETSTIQVGTIMVDMYDTAKKQLVWRGDASKTIDLKRDPGKNYKNLQKGAAKLFKNYPPQVR